MKNKFVSKQNLADSWEQYIKPKLDAKLDKYEAVTKEDIEKAIDEALYESEFVDLGLPSGLLWATCNLGANKPEEYGLYFQWGDTQGYKGVCDENESTEDNKETHYFGWSKYKFGGHNNGGQNKYNDEDNLKVLEPEDDAATTMLGEQWRMPTLEDFLELTNNTITEYVIDNKGVLLKSKINNNTIFFPFVGHLSDKYVTTPGSTGFYWSSSISSASLNCAFPLNITSGGKSFYHKTRNCGGAIRAVTPPINKQPKFQPRLPEGEIGQVLTKTEEGFEWQTIEIPEGKPENLLLDSYDHVGKSNIYLSNPIEVDVNDVFSIGVFSNSRKYIGTYGFTLYSDDKKILGGASNVYPENLTNVQIRVNKAGIISYITISTPDTDVNYSCILVKGETSPTEWYPNSSEYLTKNRLFDSYIDGYGAEQDRTFGEFIKALQPDWNSQETDPGFIKNRPFYEYLEDLLPETTLSQSSFDGSNSIFNSASTKLENGKKYIVTINGTKFESFGIDANTVVYVPCPYRELNEPTDLLKCEYLVGFNEIDSTTQVLAMNKNIDSLTIKIQQEAVKKIDPKYLPETTGQGLQNSSVGIFVFNMMEDVSMSEEISFVKPEPLANLINAIKNKNCIMYDASEGGTYQTFLINGAIYHDGGGDMQEAFIYLMISQMGGILYIKPYNGEIDFVSTDDSYTLAKINSIIKNSKPIIK